MRTLISGVMARARPFAGAWLGIVIAAFAIGLAASPATSRARDRAPPTAAREAGPAADPARFRSSIVGVETRVADDAASAETLGARRSGSGVIIGDRLVLTIGYLVLEADTVDVTTSDGKRVPGAVAAYDAMSGFGLIRTLVPISGRPLALGDAGAVGERTPVWTQGHDEPEATELRVISRRRFTGGWEYMIDQAIYTFPPVNNWSGAALIAADGRLVGIGSMIVNDAAADRRGVPGNLFVPVDLIKPVLSDLVARGRRSTPPPPWLGVSTEEVRGNVIVVRVARESPAEAAGLRTGDVIVGVGRDKIRGQEAFYRRLWDSGPAGTTITLQVLKDGEIRQIPVTSIDRLDGLHKPHGI
ncbi:MAG: S1C family serine protease [Burkholderiaceae bacterium]